MTKAYERGLGYNLHLLMKEETPVLKILNGALILLFLLFIINFGRETEVLSLWLKKFIGIQFSTGQTPSILNTGVKIYNQSRIGLSSVVEN